MMVLIIALAFFVLLAILGPLVGADSRVSGGWSPIEPGGKLWQNPHESPCVAHSVIPDFAEGLDWPDVRARSGGLLILPNVPFDAPDDREIGNSLTTRPRPRR